MTLPAMTLPRLGVGLAITAALALVLLARWGSWSAPFDDPHGWVEAHHATMGRDFAEGGLLRHGILPIQNLPPQGEQLDGYNHWPPLFPMLVAGWWTVFGEGEAQARLLMLLILITGAWGICSLATAAGVPYGWIAALIWMVVPLQAEFGLKLIHLQAALVAGIWAFVLQLRGRPRWAVVCAGLAMAFSWEPGLAFGCAFLLAPRGERRAWFNLAAAAGVVFVAVLGSYALTRPDLLENLRAALVMRSGLDPTALHHTDLHGFYDGVKNARPISFMESLQRWYDRARESLGFLLMGIVVVAPFLARSLPQQMRTIGLAWLGALLGWFLVFRNHATVHAYEMQLCLPFVGLAVAGAMAWPRLPKSVPVIVALLILMHGGLASYRSHQTRHSALPELDVRIGREIREFVPIGSIVILPGHSMLPLWYSQRHVFRGVSTKMAYENAMIRYKQLYLEPRPPFWMAITEESYPDLKEIFDARQPDYASSIVKIYRLDSE
jgi:hypothetical protein